MSWYCCHHTSKCSEWHCLENVIKLPNLCQDHVSIRDNLSSYWPELLSGQYFTAAGRDIHCCRCLSLQIYSPQVIYLPVPFPPVSIFTALLLVEYRLTVVGIPTIILGFFMTVSHIDLYVFIDFAVKGKIIYFHLIEFISTWRIQYLVFVFLWHL